MHHNNNTHTFIDSLLQSQHQFMQAMADHRDQLSETMSTMAHTYLDTSIDRLKIFHDHVANDASGLKSDMLESTLKAAIDQHQHLKDRLTVHKQHANFHKETLRRLAMGVMATFGVMSGLKAADAADTFESQENAESYSTTLAETDTAAEMRRAEQNKKKYSLNTIHPVIDNFFKIASNATKEKQYDLAVENYMKFADEYHLKSGEDQSFEKDRHEFVSQSELLIAAENVAKFGEKYYPNAVKLFMMVSNHEIPNIGKNEYKEAAERVASFGEVYYPLAVQLYMQFAKYKLTEDAKYLRDSAVYFARTYSPNGRTTDSIDMKYYEGNKNYLDIARKVAGFGERYHPEAAELFKLSAEVSPFYKLEAAKGLVDLGNTEEAIKLFKEVIQDKNSQESYIAAAREALARLSYTKSEPKEKK